MDMGKTTLFDLARVGNGIRNKRHSSYDTTGGNKDFWDIKAGETAVLGTMAGAGCIRHIWMTTRENDGNLRGLVLRMYWDGEETPSVQCPVGDFFGLGFGKAAYLDSLPLQTFYLGMSCWFSMPFAKGAKITVTNDMEQDSFLYFYIDYQEWDGCPQELSRFHACWRRELVIKKDEKVGPNAAGIPERLNTTGKDNYTILEAEGKGHYVGCVLHIDTDETGWWGEGDDMIFIDGEKWPPQIHGTGTEDYFCGAWNYNQLRSTFCTPYFGYHFKGNSDYTGKHSQYRFHIEDPIYFEKSIRMTIEHGHANDRQGDWSSTAYWYQTDRSRPLPDTETFEDRMPYAFGGLERWPGKDRSGLPG
jgi:hypothetical protein